ncbi:MAG: hypothetical protein H0V25_05770 [Solirubrobacterales bacterium]|nr:hypothetical protein [Solirubrobacterales bacterium]
MDKPFLESCLAAGMSLPEIGEVVGRPAGTVGYWVTRHGLRANGSRKYTTGKGIKREPLQELVQAGKTLGQIASHLEVGINTVRYWIERYGLPTPREVRRRDRQERLSTGDTRATRTCRHHGETEFVLDRFGWRCRRCRQEAVSRRRRKVKRILVQEAGGGCRICGYSRFAGALQFHHLDPETKRFALSQKGHTVGLAPARQEAAKCVLLCANCHAEVEAGITAAPELDTRR